MHTSSEAIANIIIGVGSIVTTLSVPLAMSSNNSDKSVKQSQNNEYTGNHTRLKDGSRIDYEYNGNGSGNIHHQDPGPNGTKTKIWSYEKGKGTYYEIPKRLKKTLESEKVVKIINRYIRYIIELSGK